MLVTALAQAEAPSWLTIANVAAFVVFIIGSGTIGKSVWSTFSLGAKTQRKYDLRKDFASVGALNGLRESLEKSMADCGDNVAAATSLAELAVQNAEEAQAKADRALRRQREMEERMMREFFAPLKALAETQLVQGEALAAQTALLKRLTEEFDLHMHPTRNRLGGGVGPQPTLGSD